MTEARPLREVFADLPGAEPADPGELLAASGHPGLPDELVAEAVVSYADTAPVEVAEHLAPYVMAHSVVPAEELADTPWYDVLATAPATIESDMDSPDQTNEVDIDHDPGLSLDFGAGAGTLDADAAPEVETPETATADEPDAEPERPDWEAPAPQAAHTVDLLDDDTDADAEDPFD